MKTSEGGGWKVRSGLAADRIFEVNEAELFAFAGIWDRWKDPSGKHSGNVLDPDHDSKRSLCRRIPTILGGWSLGLIGNASVKNSGNEVELDPRRFR